MFSQLGLPHFIFSLHHDHHFHFALLEPLRKIVSCLCLLVFVKKKNKLLRASQQREQMWTPIFHSISVFSASIKYLKITLETPQTL